MNKLNSWQKTVVDSLAGISVGSQVQSSSSSSSSLESVDTCCKIGEKLSIAASSIATINNPNYRMYQLHFGEKTPMMLYSASLASPLPGTEEEVARHFKTESQRYKARCTFDAIVELLETPTDYFSSGEYEGESSSQAEEKQVSDIVKKFSKHLALSSLVPQRDIVVYLLSHVLPHKTTRGREFLRDRLGLRDFHDDFARQWVHDNTPLDVSSWSEIETAAGGFDGLPEQLSSWAFPELKQKSQLSFAMTQSNAENLSKEYLPYMTENRLAKFRETRNALRYNMPCCDVFIVQKCTE